MLRRVALVLSLVVSTTLAPLAPLAPAAHADSTYQTLPFSQPWNSAGLITADDDWSNVPGIVGYRGDDLTPSTGTDPQTLLADGTGTPVDVIANQGLTTTLATGGLAEFDGLADPVVGMQGSGTADAPFLLLYLDTTGYQDITVSYKVRDVDGGNADNSAQQVALHFRVGASGNFTNVAAGYLADATTGPMTATLVTPITVTLPISANNQPQLQVRIMTTNAAGNDEWVGIDDILVTGQPLAAPEANLMLAKSGPATASAGSPIDYTLTLSNTGGLTATSVILTDTLPAGVTFVTYSTTLPHSFSQPAADTLVWDLGSLPSATTGATLTVQALIGSLSNGTIITNQVAAATTATETATLDNSAQAVTTIESPQPELFVTKTGPALAVAGEPLTYTLTYGNSGDAPADNVVLTDTLPAGFTSSNILSDTSGLPSADSPTTRAWTVGSLPAGQTFTFTLALAVPATQTAGLAFTNTVTLATTTAGDDPGNNASQSGARAYPLVSIHDIQFVPNPAAGNASPYAGQTVWVEGLVTSERGDVETSNRAMVIEAPGGGPWSGLYVFRSSGLPASPAAPEGAAVRLLGTVSEFNGLTELSLGTPFTLHVVNTGNALPGPNVITTGALITASTAEQWESVYIQFEDATVLTAPDGFGEWTFSDDSGAAKADDLGAVDGDLSYSAQPGDFYRYIRGIGYWSFGEYKLIPRSNADILLFYDAPSLVKTAPALVGPGALFTYTLFVTNQVGSPLTGLFITDVVPANATFAFANNGGVLVGNTVSWTVGALNHLSGTAVSFAVTATTQITPVLNTDYTVRASNWITPSAGQPVRTAVGTELHIRDLQGAGHRSPFVGQAVPAVFGIVTAVDGGGYYLQDPSPDSDDATSEAIFVDTVGAPGVSVGDAISVSATVAEFYPDFGSTAELSVTQLDPPFGTVIVSTGNPLPTPIVLGTGGRLPPNTVIEDDANGDVETQGIFDPGQDGLDFWESLEGMRVQVNNAIVVAGTRDFGEFTVVGDGGANAALLSARGALVIRESDLNPERIIIDDALVGTPVVNVGASFTMPVVGVIDYNFGNFKIQATQLPAPDLGSLISETTVLTPAAGQLTVATMNLENLDPGDGEPKFAALAARIIHNMQSPDLLALEEVQDNNGATDDGVVNSDLTLDTLVAAVVAAGGPTYSYRYVEPVNDQDGGEGGGNIRVVFFYRTDRGLAFVDRPGATSTTANSAQSGPGGPQLQYSPGRLNPTSPAFNDSRKPLAGEFTFNGARLFVIANHWNSKGGDYPLMGRYQPPTLTSESQRLLQAQEVHNFVADLLALDPNANLVVLGDLNDFQWSPPLAAVTAGGVLNILINTLPENERYSYVFDGNAQVLDHILLSDNLFDHALDGFDVVHVNAEFADAYRASDHDPSLTRLTLAGPNLSGSAKAVNTTSVIAGGLLTYTLTLSNSGSSTAFYVLTDTLDANVSLVSAPGLNGTSTLTTTGVLTPGALQVLTLTVQTSAAFSGTVHNTAQLSGDGAAHSLIAPAVTVTTAATPPTSANFAGSTKQVNTTTATGGDLLTYTLTLSNSGQLTATYHLTDALDANLTLVSAPGLNGSTTLTGTGLLAGHAQQTFVVTVRMSPTFSGTLNNTAQLSGDGQARSLNAPTVSVSALIYKFYLPLLIRQ